MGAWDDNAELRAEQAVMDKARTGIAERRMEQALAALAEHARRFPRGRYVAEREELRARGCAWLRSVSPAGGSEARCDP